MQVTIYLDLIFIINFLVDIYVLLITAWLMHQRVNVPRLCLGAFIGAVLLLPCILRPGLLFGFSGIVLTIGISMGAVSLSLGIDEVIKKWFLSTTVMVLFGGMFQFLKNHIGMLEDTFYIWFVLFLTSGLMIMFLLGLMLKIRERKSNIYSVHIRHRGRTSEVKLFLDSGNRLWDHMVNKPIIIISEESIKRILTEEEYTVIEKYRLNGYIDYNDSILMKLQRSMFFHEIAYQSVGKNDGKLLCFLVDDVKVEGKDRCYQRQPVAIADKMLFAAKDYKGLLFEDVI